MIPFDFEYYRPESIDEALDLYHRLDAEHKAPLYYSGGTEIISMARVSSIWTGAVIDLKAIPEFNVFEIQSDSLIIGAGNTLAHITETDAFPLLGKVVSRIADHTIQCKICLGGNLCGTIIYREAVLPLLVSDAKVVIAGDAGRRTVPLSDAFNQRLCLDKGELLLQIMVPREMLRVPFFHSKDTKLEKIDYPLVTTVLIAHSTGFRAAFSGLAAYPFRSSEMEEALNDVSLPAGARCARSVERIPHALLSDLHGSAEYRRFVLTNTLVSGVSSLEAIR